MEQNRNPAADDAASGVPVADHSRRAAGTEANSNASGLQYIDRHKAADLTVMAIAIESVRGAPGNFAARLLGDDCILAQSRTPFCDAARKLLDLGFDPAAMLVMTRAGSATVCLRAPLGVAANLTVEESAHGPVFRRYRNGSPSAVEAPRARSGGRAATDT
jgi:hypothetical protein